MRRLEDWSDGELLEELDEEGLGLTPWEIEFTEKCMQRSRSHDRELSPKQRAKLIEIIEQRCEL
jgi:hypothetical protein